MNEKENFYKRIDNYRKIYEDSHEQNRQYDIQEKEKTREERQREIVEAKKEFEGTGIIEAFEAIRDKESLCFARLAEYKWIESGSQMTRVNFADIIPAKIDYTDGGNDSKGQISLILDVEYQKGNEYNKPSYGYHALNINKIDDNKFIYWIHKPNEKKNATTVTGDKEDMVNFIAWFVVENTPYFYAYDKDGQVGYTNQSVHNFSEKLDQKIN